jgi:hypothetical protein
MSNKAKSSGVGGGSQSKKIKGPLATLFNSSTNEQIMNSMNSRFIGKRILLKALDIYGGRGKVPPGEEDFLFQYHLASINNDCKSALLHYDEKCIKNGGDQFTSYPDTTGNESTILNYRLELFSVDHELFNTHQGRVNRIINDEKDLMRKMEQDTTHHKATDDVSDLEAKISDGSTVYALLVAEFQPCGDFRPHSIAKGPHKGKQIKKQKWSKCILSTHILINLDFPHPFFTLLCYAFCTSNTYHCTEHKYSDYDFEWHTKIKKEKEGRAKEEEEEEDVFVTDKPWKAARYIISKGSAGSMRLKYLLSLSGKALVSTADADGTKYARGEDMTNRVVAVMAAVGSNIPLSIFDNVMFKNYLRRLDSKHRTPYRLERTRIIEVLMDGAMQELSRIIKERRDVLEEGFVSASTDFWTDSHRRQQFGALIINMIAEKYFVEDTEQWLFMSHETAMARGKKAVSYFSFILCIHWLRLP